MIVTERKEFIDEKIPDIKKMEARPIVQKINAEFNLSIGRTDINPFSGNKNTDMKVIFK